MLGRKYLHKDRDRYGNDRYYVVKPGKPKIRIREKPGTAAFDDAYWAAMESRGHPRSGVPKVRAGHFVYAIGYNWKPLKIGNSRDPRLRAKEMQNGNHRELKIRRAFWCRSASDAATVELCTHRILHERRMESEWFDVNAAEAEAAIRSAADLSGIEIIDYSGQFRRGARWPKTKNFPLLIQSDHGGRSHANLSTEINTLTEAVVPRGGVK